MSHFEGEGSCDAALKVGILLFGMYDAHLLWAPAISELGGQLVCNEQTQ